MTPAITPANIANTKVEFRLLMADELEAAYQLELTCYIPEAAATLEAFRFRQMNFPDYFWSAWTEQRLVGLACAVRTSECACEENEVKGAHEAQRNGMNLCVLSVAVDPGYRLQRVGAALVKKLIEQATTDQLESIFLMCEAHLIPFYEQQGFSYIGLSSSKHGGIEWHEMKLILS